MYLNPSAAVLPSCLKAPVNSPEPFHESDAEWPGFDDAFPGYDEQ